MMYYSWVQYGDTRKFDDQQVQGSGVELVSSTINWVWHTHFSETSCREGRQVDQENQSEPLRAEIGLETNQIIF